MKNVSLVLNVLLILAVSFLYLNVFQKEPAAMEETTPQKEDLRTLPEPRTTSKPKEIAFFNGDSVLFSSKFAKDYFEKMNLVRDSKIGKLQKKQALYKKKYEDMVKARQAGLRNMAQLQKDQQELNTLREQILKMEQEAQGELSKTDAELKQEIDVHLATVLEKVNRDNKYLYIFNQSSGAFYASANAVDLTGQLLTELDKIYDLKNSK